MNTDLEPFYLYILSLLPVRELKYFDTWHAKAGSFEKIYFANHEQLLAFDFPEKLITKFVELKQDHSVEKLVRSLEQTAVQILPYYDSRYPKLLKEIFDAPPVLFYRGKLGDPNEACVAIVGSRKMSSYGAVVMPKITKPLIDAGVTIVSGLAYGADSAAHAESVKAGARTIAVLGSGVDDNSIYPRGHLRLAHDILDCGGLIISEHPPGTPGLKFNFVARNRIIAGLSLGIVIVECKAKSGALITADYAADFNRTLYAVPGPIYSSLSDGPNNLIKTGAALLTSGEEILEDLALTIPEIKQHSELAQQQSFSKTELLVLECMQDTPCLTESIIKETKLPSQEVMQAITLLELKSKIKNLGTQGFIKT